jgi:hypothetical protein
MSAAAHAGSLIVQCSKGPLGLLKVSALLGRRGRVHPVATLAALLLLRLLL